MAAKQFVFLHFWYLGTAKSKETTSWKPRKQQQTASFPTFFIGWQQKISRFRNFQNFFRKFSDFFSEISENFLKNFWKFSEKCLKFFKIGENQRKSLKMAAKQFVFLHFWYLGIAKSKETTSWKPRKQQQTASFPTFFIGWQQKISRFRNFQKFFRKFSDFFQKFLKFFWKISENFLKNVWNFSKLEKNQRKSLKIAAKQFVFLHFWYLGTAKSKETTSWKPRKQQQTAGWQQKISRFRNFSENFQIFSEIFENFLKKFWKMSEFFQNWRKPTQKFENSSKTVRFPPLLVPGNCKK